MVSRRARIHGWVWKTTAVIWAGLIFDLSTGTFGGSYTAWLLHQILALLHVTVSAYTFEMLHHVIRKLAHITEYAIFAMLLYGASADDRPFRWRPRRAFWCVVIAGVYSLTDELHQTLVPGRGPSLVDCGIDTAGATAGVLVYYLDHLLFPAKLPAVAETRVETLQD